MTYYRIVEFDLHDSGVRGIKSLDFIKDMKHRQHPSCKCQWKILNR